MDAPKRLTEFPWVVARISCKFCRRKGQNSTVLLTVAIMAIVAEQEPRMISTYTKAALAAAKARGTVLGGFRGMKVDDDARTASIASRKATASARAGDVAPTIAELRAVRQCRLDGRL